jgi:NhaA family Na+:H+ antiporter
MPLFAFANAGVSLAGITLGALGGPVPLGIAAGLFAGKQAGVMAAVWIATRLSSNRLPENVTWLHVYGMSVLTGIGFTMSLFISDLAFSDGELVETAKLGILVASLIAGTVGWTMLRTAASLPTRRTLEKETL